MEKISFETIKKDFPDEAKEFASEQAALVILLNSPEKGKWIKSLNLKEEARTIVHNIVDAYAKCKVNAEKAQKPKSREDIISIENDCLKLFYEAHLLKLKNIARAEALKLAPKILEEEYPLAVILGENEIEKISKLAGIRAKFPNDYLIFEPKRNKIIGINVVQ